MAARLDLLEGPKLKQEDFEEYYGRVTDHLYFECVDDRGNGQGYAVAEVVKKFRADKDGAFLQVRYLQTSDPYYAHWLASSGGGNFFHHLCTHSLRTCTKKVGRDNLVHVLRWMPVSSELVPSIVKGWKTKPLPHGAPVPPKGVPLVEEPLKTAPKRKPESGRHEEGRTRGRSPGDGRGSRRISGDEHEVSEDGDVGRSNARRRRRHRSDRTPEDDSRDERGQPEKARGTVGAVTRGKEALRRHRTTPLDAMLDDDVLDPMQSKADERFDELRKALEEKKRTRADASAVLAKRVLETPEGGQKKRKKESEKDKVHKALKILSGKKKEESSGSESPSEDDDGSYLRGESKDSDLLGRQKKLRRMSSAKPGCLLARGYGLMHEQLGTLHGDKGGNPDKEALLQPAAVRYLLSSALPLTDLKKVGEEKLRELRTLACSLDLLVSGRVGAAGDHMMQRMKSILMGMRDGSTAASRYLELIPTEVYPMAATMEETDYARELAVKHAKSERLLEQVSRRG